MKTFLLSVITAFLLQPSPQGNVNGRDSNGKRHGVWEKFYEDGTLRYRGTFSHGIPVDTFKYYFENGDLRTVNVFRAKSGNCMSYQYGDGEILAGQGLYIDQKKDSVWTFYDQDGNVVMREQYENDKKHGFSKSLFPDGKVAEILHYKDGVKNGEWKQYYESGKKMAEGTYKDGSLHGEATYYHSNGKPRLKGKYVNGLMHGVWYHFGQNLQIEKKQIWRYGYLQEKDKDKDSSAAPVPK